MDGPLKRSELQSIRAQAAILTMLLLCAPIVARATIRFDVPLVSQRAGYAYSEYSSIRPFEIVVADLNRDGIPDVASPVAGDSIVISLGTQDGTLASPISVAAPGGATFCASADFDADGFMDLAYADRLGAGVLFGDGTGHGWARMALPTLNGIAVAAADFDGDGIPDVAIVSQAGSPHIETFLSRPSRTYQLISQPQADLSGSGYPSTVRIADMNLDGRMDLVLSFQNYVSVLLSRGDGTFQALPQFLGGKRIDIADLTGDGRPDVVAAQGDYLKLFPGLGDGTMGAGIVIATSPPPILIDVAIGDMNHDGRPDIVTTDMANRVVVRLATATGAYAPPQVTAMGRVLLPCFLVDMNRDERLDLVAMSMSAPGVFIARGDGTGGFEEHATTVVVPRVGKLVAADFDQDGAPDLVSCTSGTPPLGLWLLLSRPARVFVPAPVVLPDSIANSIEQFWGVSDVNMDQRPDLILVLSGSRIGIMRGNGDGSFQAPVISAVAGRLVSVGDATGDGLPDGVFVSGDSVLCMPGDGNGSLGAPIVSTMPNWTVEDAAMGQLDGSGPADLALKVSWQNPFNPSHAIMVATGTAPGTWSPGAVFDSDALYYPSIAVTDLDGDGRDDLLYERDQCTTCGWNGRLTTRLQQPNGTLANGIPNTWGGGAPIRFADVNGDGNIDLSAASPSGWAVGRGDGHGRFEIESAYAGPLTPFGMADFDRDGRPDLYGFDGFSGDSVRVYFGRDSQAPVPSFLSPTAGVFLRVGEPTHISWTISDAEDLRSIELYLSRNGARGPFERITTQEPAGESLDWTVTGPLSASAFFKLVARDSAGNVGVELSKHPLAIVAPLAVESDGITVPSHPAILNASPNPALDRIGIEYSLPSSQRVTIALHDLQGRRVATLFKGRSPRGRSRVNWEAERIAPLPPAGMYFIRLNAENGSDVLRVVLAR